MSRDRENVQMALTSARNDMAELARNMEADDRAVLDSIDEQLSSLGAAAPRTLVAVREQVIQTSRKTQAMLDDVWEGMGSLLRALSA